MRLTHRLAPLVAAATIVAPLGLAGAAHADNSADARVTSGSPHTNYPQNKQNEPGVAVDPTNPQFLAAGANEEIDEPQCGASTEATATRPCPFVTGIGNSGVYFSTDGGASWTQPTYTGYSGRRCLYPLYDHNCTPTTGPIGTLPKYDTAGLVSDGDPIVAFGPKPDGHGGFTYANGARLYYANLTSNFSANKNDAAFKGFEAIAVSRSDDLAGAVAGNNDAWMAPVIVSKQNAALFSDKEDVWADNAQSSSYFGNVYECNASFRSQQANGPEPILFTRSTDGGATWGNPMQLSPAVNGSSGNGPKSPNDGRQGCTLRTDSHGVIYVVWLGAANGHSVHYLDRSFDGGKTFEKPRPVASVVDVGYFDPEQGDVTFDGVNGARTDSFPSLDIANGAPSGAGATNTIVLGWSDARHATKATGGEESLVEFSRDGGNSFSAPVTASAPGDRPDFTAIAVAPDGSKVYAVYDNFAQPWQPTTADPRPFAGVVRGAVLGASNPAGPWALLHTGVTGDARSSSSNSLTDEFLGDYNYAAATNTYGAAVWNDSRNGSDCPAIDAYRQALTTQATSTGATFGSGDDPFSPPKGQAAGPTKPFPPTDCPATFGESDIYGGGYTLP